MVIYLGSSYLKLTIKINNTYFFYLLQNKAKEVLRTFSKQGWYTSHYKSLQDGVEYSV